MVAVIDLNDVLDDEGYIWYISKLCWFSP